MGKVNLYHVAQALDTIMNELNAVKKTVEVMAAGGDPDYDSGSTTRGIMSGECPPPEASSSE